MSARILALPALLLVQTGCGLCSNYEWDRSRTGGGDAWLSIGDAESSQVFEVSGSSFGELGYNGPSDRAWFEYDEVTGDGSLHIGRTGDDFALCGVQVRDVAVDLIWWGNELAQAQLSTDWNDDAIEVPDQDLVVTGDPPVPGTAGTAAFTLPCPDQVALVAIDWELNPFVSAHDSGEARSCSAAMWN